MAFCTECGADIPAGIRFCTGCGKPVDVLQTAKATAPAAMPVQAPAAATVPDQQQPPPSPIYQAQAPMPVLPTARQRATDAAPSKGSKYAVMGTGAYFGTMLLFCIPIIGWIACLVMAFSGSNQNRKNFARAMLIFLIIGIVLSVALYFVSTWVFEVLMEYAVDTAQSGLYGLAG